MYFDTLDKSAVLTLIGMAVIFFFMGLLILIVHFWVRIAGKLFPDTAESGGGDAGAVAPDSGVPSAVAGDDGAVVAAIAVALREKN